MPGDPPAVRRLAEEEDHIRPDRFLVCRTQQSALSNACAKPPAVPGWVRICVQDKGLRNSTRRQPRLRGPARCWLGDERQRLCCHCRWPRTVVARPAVETRGPRRAPSHLKSSYRTSGGRRRRSPSPLREPPEVRSAPTSSAPGILRRASTKSAAHLFRETEADEAEPRLLARAYRLKALKD